MSMNSPHESVKDLVGHIWNNNRPLAVAILAVGGVGIFILIKKHNAAIVAPTATPEPGVSGTPTVINNYTSTITKTITQAPGVVPAPKTQIATIRPRQSAGADALWDKTQPGVPVRSQPSGQASVVRVIPFGTSIALLQAKLTGAVNQKGGSSDWYPVQGGYLSAWDIASIR
jgi:hypothetical protein